MDAWIPPEPHLFSSLSPPSASAPALDVLPSSFSTLLCHFSITTTEAQTFKSSPYPPQNYPSLFHSQPAPTQRNGLTRGLLPPTWPSSGELLWLGPPHVQPSSGATSSSDLSLLLAFLPPFLKQSCIHVDFPNKIPP